MRNRSFAIIIFIAYSFMACNNPSTSTPGPIEDTLDKILDTASNTPPQNYKQVYRSTDISPMDMIYYPIDYPKLKMANAIKTGPSARIIYSRPHLQGRQLFKDILRYGELWRLGANEATELAIYKPVTIENRIINPGRYTLYCIPDSLSWTIILNNNADIWGLRPDTTKDIARFTATVKPSAYKLEYFTMQFEDADTGTDLVMAWENTEARLPIEFK